MLIVSFIYCIFVYNWYLCTVCWWK